MIENEVLRMLSSAGVVAKRQHIVKPPNPDLGDLSFPCFHMAKTFKKNPADIAKELAKKIRVPKGSVVSKVEARGGYVNFYFDYPKFSKVVFKELSKNPAAGKKETVMIEYSQPNPVHPMHMGHARNTFLGDSLANIYDFAGHKTIRANYMNNFGLQVAKLVMAYKLWSGGRVPNTKPDLWLWKYYIKFHEESENDKRLDAEAHSVLKSYELDGDKNVEKVWNKIVDWCVSGFKETYKRTGVRFDVYFYESDYRKLGKKVVEETLKKGISKKTEDGAVFIDLEPAGLPGTIIQRSDGTGLYITSDLGLTIKKFSKYKLDRSIWVSHSQQDLHFKQVFKIFELLGYDFYKDCKHFSYEWVKLEEGKMSSREGKAVMLDEVLDRLTERAYTEVKKRNPKMPIKKMKKISEQIAVGALKYAIVRIEPKQDITFNWDQILSLEGNTGPYLQYAHTRCSSILRKAKKFSKNHSYPDMNEKETALIRKLSEFNGVVESSLRDTRPHVVCNYGHELATAFNSFYQHSNVLKSDNAKQRNFRLTLVGCTRDILERVFGMVGMEAPQKM